MEKIGKEMKKTALILGVGGLGYNLVELLWRGHSHWTMTVAGGVCFGLMYGIQQAVPTAPLLKKCMLSAASVTAVEFLCGCVVNLWLDMNVWDYSSQRGNLYGQVCLLYSFLWFLLSAPCLLLCEKIEKMIGER